MTTDLLQRGAGADVPVEMFGILVFTKVR